MTTPVGRANSYRTNSVRCRIGILRLRDGGASRHYPSRTARYHHHKQKNKHVMWSHQRPHAHKRQPIRNERTYPQVIQPKCTTVGADIRPPQRWRVVNAHFSSLSRSMGRAGSSNDDLKTQNPYGTAWFFFAARLVTVSSFAHWCPTPPKLPDWFASLHDLRAANVLHESSRAGVVERTRLRACGACAAR